MSLLCSFTARTAISEGYYRCFLARSDPLFTARFSPEIRSLQVPFLRENQREIYERARSEITNKLQLPRLQSLAKYEDSLAKDIAAICLTKNLHNSSDYTLSCLMKEIDNVE